MLKITERQTGDVTILDLEGNIIMGGGSAQLRETTRRLIAQGKKKILLNFTGVKFLDSSGIGQLIASSVALNRTDGHLKLLNPSERVKEVLDLTSLLSVFEIYDDESKALTSYASSA